MNLNEKFNQHKFSEWIEKFLPEFSLDHRKVDVPSGFSGVKSVITLGESNIGVRVFIIETEKDPSGRKIGLAKESFNLIKNYGTPNALIAYYSEESSKWRLSLLTSTPEWSQGKIITKLSNPKRQSYVLGPQAKVNTPNRFLLKRETVSDISDLKSRFSLEVVNKEFYKEISESFIKLVGGTLGTGRSQKKYGAILKLPFVADHSQTSIEFAVRLIGRIIFCWFLREKKGPDGTSLMPKELVSLDAIKDNSDYYHQVLEPIFFEVLNQQVKARKDPFYDKPYSLIPYLNGGLFSPHEDDFYKRKNGDFQSQFHNTLIIPDEWFVELFNTLETYNFTIDENTSFDEELSIDPEMLGRIFENLLAEINPETGESARKSTGSYYTPRVIVDYMVDESLILYLKQKTEIEESKLRAIISYDLTDDTQYPLNDTEKQKAIDALEKIKILDPACGSGAFPIGALQKMVFILQQIDPDGQLWFKKQIQHTSPEIRRVLEREFTHKNFDYIRKLGVIRENIYGIDIQPIATEISRLRCFLTLVVDERIDDSLENRGIEPLPNLDFKFVTANSLIGLPATGKQVQFGLFEDSEGISELKEIRDLFFNASGSEREVLKLQFVQSQNKMFQRLISEGRRGHADLTTKLTSWDPFSHKASDWFDPEWMFGMKEGFDVVIANPPYIQLSKTDISKEIKQYLLDRYKTSSGRFNTFGFFTIFGLDLVKQQGVLTYIIPNTILSQEYYQYIRKYILDNSQINEIVNYNDMVFESAVVENITIFLSKLSDLKKNHVTKVSNQTENSVEVLKEINQESFYSSYKNQFDIKGDSITNKIEHTSNTEKLSSLCNINQAIALKNDRSKSLLEDPKLGSEVYKLLDGRNVQRYKINWTGVYLNYDLKKIHSCKRKDIFLKDEKLLFRRVSSNLVFAYDNNQFFALNTLVVVTIKDKYLGKYSLKYLLSILNSKLVNYYYFHKYKSTKNVFSEIQARSVGLIPIPLISLSDQQKFISIVDDILSADKDDILKQYDDRINEMVYKLYDLTDDEVSTVEGKQNS